ncbi:HAD family hydrolase, partial [Nocardioides sp. GCM10030258]|uniref:HAD family hydrolase n=1 Tax=unclassified Nocardioides TaxID=2615069 RepID=UPI0036166CAF
MDEVDPLHSDCGTVGADGGVSLSGMSSGSVRGIDAVLFDYGGVLTGPVKHSIANWLAADAIEPESFSGALQAWLSRNAPDGTPVHRLETGELTVAEFERLLAAELRTTDGSAVVPDGILSRLFAGMLPDAEMFLLAEELRFAGLEVGLLSNSWGNTYPRARIDALLDPVVISGEVGLRKPHAAIYELALDRLGLPADRVLFIDDAEP